MARTDRLPRRRLDADTRREAILTAGVAAFRDAPYAEVKITEVAEAAGASAALVFRYFGTKAGLYAQVVRASLDDLLDAQTAAVEELGDGAPAREQVKAMLVVYLDHIAAHPTSWAHPFVAGDEPPEALAERMEARAEFAVALRGSLNVTAGWLRHDFAMHGYVGFVEQACLAWALAGCPEEQRWPLIETCLGALEGALGDWGNPERPS